MHNDDDDDNDDKYDAVSKDKGRRRRREIKDDISLRYVGIKGNVFSVLFLAIL